MKRKIKRKGRSGVYSRKGKARSRKRIGMVSHMVYKRILEERVVINEAKRGQQ